MRIFLTKRAVRDYNSIKQYLKKEWGENVAEAFEHKTTDFLNLLKDFPKMGSLEVQEKQIRGIVLTKQVKLFYRIKSNQIIILTFFDVRQDPKGKLI